ncbi:hypothetical protein SO802_004449 [Lithocarpus litseifolius]|uniref:EF-hand domain-containing protein n=1 Tax=Lithocarpus litseifolius TaxID=425828 RepID=A0AAW2E6X3_9ROSI
MPVWSPRSTSYPLSEEQLKGLLKRYDTNGDGKLSKNELKAAFRSLGLHFSGWRAGQALRHADANGDGYVSEEEMKELVKYPWGSSKARLDLAAFLTPSAPPHPSAIYFVLAFPSAYRDTC